MASAAAEQQPSADLPPGWERLGGAVENTLGALSRWRRRALDAEDEVARLRQAMNDLLKGSPEGDGAPVDELQRLRAENALYLSRIMEARKRVGALLARVSALEEGR